MNLSSVDLNLLVAFDILIREQNLSHAADKLGLTQPAMSKRRTRLRSLFGDELLVRTSKGMKPTARTLELVEPIRIATTDLVAISVIPKLMQRQRKASLLSARFLFCL